MLSLKTYSWLQEGEGGKSEGLFELGAVLHVCDEVGQLVGQQWETGWACPASCGGYSGQAKRRVMKRALSLETYARGR